MWTQIVSEAHANLRNDLIGLLISAFIDDDGDFDASIDYAENSNASNQANDSYNNNSYSQDAAEDSGEGDSEDDDDEEGSDEDFEVKYSRDKDKKLPIPPKTVENIDYIKDEEGKFVCQICNKKLADKKGLTLHIRLHTGENLKRCNICNRGA